MGREYLTGFQKRNVERKRAAKERFDKLVKEEKAEKRKEVRLTRCMCRAYAGHRSGSA